MIKLQIMTLTIEIASETEKLLRTEARRKGLSPDQVVKGMLKERFPKGKNKKGIMSSVLQEMLLEGMISRVPKGISTDEDDFEPIEISGKPLSETILEDRN